MKKILILLAFLLLTGCGKNSLPENTDKENTEKVEITEENKDIIPLIPLEEATIPLIPLTKATSDIPFYHLRVEPPKEVVATEEKTIYLTFDDGPSDRTIEVLDILKEYDIKATFFVTCQQEIQTEEKYTNILKRIVEEGHTIGVHTYSHNYKDIYSSVDSFLKDFEMISDHILKHTGVTPNIFRFAGGSRNSFNKDTAQDIIDEMTSRGYVYYDWNVSAEDAVGKVTEQQVINNIIQTMGKKTRAFVLMHDSEYMISTVNALNDIIQYGINQNYKFDKITNQTKPVKF